VVAKQKGERIVKNLIICTDGTWNDSDSGEESTNVWKIYNAVSEFDSHGVRQLKYYHPGVGTDPGIVCKLAGGIYGAGLGKHIRSAYKWLCDNYEDGDRIYMFGFSRGAYTIRSLAGMIGHCGLMIPANDPSDKAEREVWNCVKKIYLECYRGVKRDDESDDTKCRQRHENVKIHFLGAWDTVGALGIPDNMAITNLLDNTDKYRFHDTELGNHILHARHALAIDEMRGSYTPTLWNNTQSHPDVVEKWFVGVHSDIGGGYAENSLSDISLLWMAEEAQKFGLSLDENTLSQTSPDAIGPIHDSLKGIFSLMRTIPRAIPPLSEADSRERIHHSVMERCGSVSIKYGRYRPNHTLRPRESVTVDIYTKERWNWTGVYISPGAIYHLEATGGWMDRDIPCNPDGIDESGFHISHIAYLSGDMVGKVENIYRKILKNDNADLRGSKRVENIDWCVLVGAIANERNPTADGTPDKMQYFSIDSQRRIEIERGGYLYAFVNDSWHFYDNNHGSMKLKITRES